MWLISCLSWWSLQLHWWYPYVCSSLISPPPQDKYVSGGPAAYMAFAIITGILAVVAGIVYCCAVVGYLLKKVC